MLFVCITACRHPEKKEAIIYYKKKIIDLGEIKANKKNTGFIRVFNKGNSELRLTDIRPDCVCTQMALDSITVSPKDSADLHFTVRPSVTGFIEQYVIVQNNSSNEKNVMFIIRANASL